MLKYPKFLADNLLSKTLSALIAAISIHSLSAAELSIEKYTVHVEDGMIRIFVSEKEIISLESILFDYHTALSSEVIESTEDSIVLLNTYSPSVDYYSTAEDTKEREAKITISRNGQGIRIHSNPTWSNQTTLVLQDLGGSIFGLVEPLQPDNRLSPNLRDSVVNVEVASEGENLAENYASAFSSFFLNSLGYGSFFDTFARGRYEIALNGKTRIHHETGNLDLYLFFGDDGPTIHSQYFELIGTPKASPLWGLGPIIWRDHNESSDEILADVEGFKELKIPTTAWFVDRPYSDGNHSWSEMNFSENFENPKKWIAELNDDFGVEFMTWTATAMFGSKRFPKHFDGKFTYLDLSHPETYDQYKSELQQKQYSVGVKGHKMDRADEGFPYHEDWHDESVPIPQRRNKYVYLFSKVHHEALTEAWGSDHVNFARAAIHRTQPYVSSIWGGDSRSNWAGLRANIANGIRSSFMGFPVWGTDVGGYLGDGYIDEKLYIRWLQAGSMNGLFEIKMDGAGGQGEDRMPWRYGERLQGAFRSVCEDRMNLLPYLYSLSNTVLQNGTLMQPMAYRHPSDPNTHELWDQYYFGPSMLVAPILSPNNSREVYFPAGEWIDYNSPDKRYKFPEGTSIQIEASLEEIPRWVPANSLIVSGSIYPGSSKSWEVPDAHLTIKAYPSSLNASQTFEYVDALDSGQSKIISMDSSSDSISVAAPAFTIPVTVEIYLPDSSTSKKTFKPGETVTFTVTR